MKTKLLTSAVYSTVIAMALVGCNQQANSPKDGSAGDANVSADKLTTETERVSYGMGVNLGGRIKQEFDLDVDAFALGIRHSVEGGEQLMTNEEIQQELMAFQQSQVAKHEAEQAQVAADNLAASEAFLAENANKEGVTTTDTGLQYKIITEGSGPKPSAEDTVEVHYRGTLIDGTEFDSSYKRGQTVSFPVGGVIPGWTEALQLMPTGSKWELYIPSDLAYGPGGTGGPIGPNQALVFEVELISIKDDAEETNAAEG